MQGREGPGGSASPSCPPLLPGLLPSSPQCPRVGWHWALGQHEENCPGGQPEAEAHQTARCREGTPWRVAGAGRALGGGGAPGAAAQGAATQPVPVGRASILLAPHAATADPAPASGVRAEKRDDFWADPAWKEAGPPSAAPVHGNAASQTGSIPLTPRPDRPWARAGALCAGNSLECLQSVCVCVCLVCECAPAGVSERRQGGPPGRGQCAPGAYLSTEPTGAAQTPHGPCWGQHIVHSPVTPLEGSCGASVSVGSRAREAQGALGALGRWRGVAEQSCCPGVGAVGVSSAPLHPAKAGVRAASKSQARSPAGPREPESGAHGKGTACPVGTQGGKPREQGLSVVQSLIPTHPQTTEALALPRVPRSSALGPSLRSPSYRGDGPGEASGKQYLAQPREAGVLRSQMSREEGPRGYTFSGRGWLPLPDPQSTCGPQQ